MRTVWEGYYLDGQTAARRRATIRLMRSGLQVAVEDGPSVFWSYAESRLTQGAFEGQQARLERPGESPEALVVDDAAFLGALRQLAPELAGPLSGRSRRRVRTQVVVLAAIGAIAVGAGLYLWGIPMLATAVVPLIPVAWEERLGREVIQELAPPGKRCQDPSGAQAIDEIVVALTRSLDRRPYTIRVVVVNDHAVNAFAVPGGSVLILRGLLERTRSAEELAGVLAHEIQHVLRRHATRMLVEHASVGILVGALSGDTTGLGHALQAARVLGTLRYSREAEEEADRQGIELLLRAGIDPHGMITFFETLERQEPEAAAALTYLSTHPSTRERTERLRALAAGNAGAPVTLAAGQDWREIRAMCRR